MEKIFKFGGSETLFSALNAICTLAHLDPVYMEWGTPV